MTVSTEVDHNDYIGNGVTTSFPYTFRIFTKSDLVVQVVDLNENITELILDTDYTVTGAGGYTGGNVILSTALANGYQISISRELPVTQETDLRNQGKFFAEVHEDAFDKLTMLIQQAISWLCLSLRKPSFVANYYDALNNYIRNLRDPSRPQDAATKNYVDNLSVTNSNRAIRVPEPFISSLPDIDGRKNKSLSFDNAGEPLLLDPAQSGLWGYVLIDSFQLGANITTRFQALHWSLPDGNGEYYRWDGGFPKVVAPGSTPASTGGVGLGAWVSVGDASLRRDINLNGGVLVMTNNGETLDDRLGKSSADSFFFTSYYKSASSPFEALKLAIADAKLYTGGVPTIINSHSNIEFTEGIVIDFRCNIDMGNATITSTMVGGVLIKLTGAQRIEIGNFEMVGSGTGNTSRAFWANNAALFTLYDVKIRGFKENVWIDGVSYGHYLTRVDAGNPVSRGIYCDVATAAEAYWTDVYVGCNATWVTTDTIGIEMYASTSGDTGGYYWNNVLTVNNYTAGSRCGIGIYLNGSNNLGATPIHWLGGGADGAKTAQGLKGLVIRNWSQVMLINLWATNVEINSADSPQVIGGVCTEGFTLKGTIKDPVFSGVRCKDGPYAFILDPALIIGGTLNVYGVSNQTIANDLTRFYRFTKLGVNNYTGSSDKRDSERYADTIQGVKFYRRINSAGELVFLKSDFTDHSIFKQNGVLNVPGGFSPFTGFHVYYSNDEMLVGEPAILLDPNITPVNVEGNIIYCDGVIGRSDMIGDPRCVGVVGNIEESGAGYIIHVAAVGDSSFPGLTGIAVDGLVKSGDYVTNGQNGTWVVTNSKNDAIMRVKGVRKDGTCYCFFVS